MVNVYRVREIFWYLIIMNDAQVSEYTKKYWIFTLKAWTLYYVNYYKAVNEKIKTNGLSNAL